MRHLAPSSRVARATAGAAAPRCGVLAWLALLLGGCSNIGLVSADTGSDESEETGVPDDEDDEGDDTAGGGSGSGSESGSGSGSGSGSDDTGSSTGGETGSTGGDDTGSVDNTGLTTGLAELSYLVVGCPSCFGMSEQVQVAAGAAVHDPASGSWSDWMPPQGSCTLNPTRSGPASSFLDVGSFVYLESGGTSLPLSRDTSTGAYQGGSLSQSDYVKSAAFDLAVPDGGSLGAFTAGDVLQSTSGFDDLQPLEMLGDGAQSFPRMSASNMSFTWSPSGVSDGIVVDILVYSADGASFLGEIYCYASDSGALTVPSSAFSGMPSGALMAIYLLRWESSSGTSPLDNSTIEGISTFGGLGTGTLRP